MRILLPIRPPMPHRVSASNEINVSDDINNNSLASNFEPAIRTIVNHLNRLKSMLVLVFYFTISFGQQSNNPNSVDRTIK